MEPRKTIIVKWCGAAHYHIYYDDLTIIVDPLYTRLPGDKPHLKEARDGLEKVDYLLLTHGHLDHSWDFPYLAAKYNPEIYAPEECLRSICRKKGQTSSGSDDSKHHRLEALKGKPFNLGEIRVTPYQIGTEEIDFWFIRSMFWRPIRHGTPFAMPTGLRWLMHHLYCNCFAYHFLLPPEGKSMLFFGNLTSEVAELANVDRVNVLAIPYCPANQKWLRHSQILIERFRPDVTMIHHFDNFMNPFTLSKYMNLDDYRRAIHEKCPGAMFYFSKFGEEMDFARIAAGGQTDSA